MKSVACLLVAFALALTTGQPASAQDLGNSIVGVWKLKSNVRKVVATGKTENTFGEKPIGQWTFTRGGHFIFAMVSGDRKKPAGAALTDAERVDLFKTLSFGSGTYKVSGDKVTAHYDTSWLQSWTGSARTFEPKISGNILTVTSAPFKSGADGQESVTVTVWERVE
jgi:hypothetical protein